MFACLLATSLFLATGGLWAAPRNMLANPGFEKWHEGLPAGWTKYGGSELCTLKPSADAHSGQTAAVLDDRGPEARDIRSSIGVYQELDAEPGRIYVASVWAKCISRNRSGAVRLQLTFLPSNKSHSIGLDGKIGGGWQMFSVAAAAPPGTEKLRLYIYTIHYWQSTTVIDDASLTSMTKEEAGDFYSALAWGTVGVRRVRKLNLTTPIVRGGEARAAIVAQPSGEIAAAAKRLQRAIEELTGVRLPIVAPTRQLVRERRTLIALGNLNNNAVIERLMWNKYLKIDALTPGPGNYDIRIVYEPYNWPRGVNIVVVGASDFEGLNRGVGRFIAIIKTRASRGELSFTGPLLEISGVKPLTPAQAREILDRPISRDALKDFWQAAQLYRDTGLMVYAQRARKCLLYCVRRFNENPADFITWPEETTSQMIGAMWDVVEELPIFSDRERLQITNMLICVMHNLRGHVSGFGIWHDGDRITWNHTTFPLLGIYYIARYIERFYGDPDGKIAPLMAEVRGAFAGQVKSWKPQEDADAYMLLTPRHTIDYTLAEGDYSYFDSGNVRRWAEYVTGWCDNLGRNGGFGDSGLGTVAVHERQALPWALWYYRDGRYLWRLRQVYGDRWQNPYDPAVKPVVWKQLVGLTVFELHPELYRYARNWPFYGEPLNPPNVPLEKCFDKVVLRGGLKPDDQYLLLDGFASGKHLHYDGNAINVFVDLGQRWLLDHDYLVRNTTEHNMVTVTRRGRCPVREPVCAALESYSEFADCAALHTAVYDWNGADWHRYLVWLKGLGVVCLDRCVARQADSYGFEAVWKMLDDGRFSLRGGRMALRRFTGPPPGNWRVRTITAPAPGVSAAVEFFDRQSKMEFAVELPAGRYALVIYAKGTGTGANSFWVQIDDGEKIAFHTPVGRFGPSSAAWDGSKPTPTIAVPRSGPHRITVTMRENPPQYIDRFEFRDASGKLVARVEAEEARLPENMAGRPRPELRFYIHTNGRGFIHMSRRINNVRLKFRYLHQRMRAHLDRGGEVVFHTLFYAERPGAPRELTLAATGDNWARIEQRGRPLAFVQLGPADRPIKTDAELLVVYGGKVYVNGCTTLAGATVAGRPACFAVDLADGRVSGALKARPTASLPARLPGGALKALRAGARAALSLRGRRPQASRAEQAAAPELEPLWRLQPWQPETADAPARIAGVVPADVDGDGALELLVLRGPQVVCLTAEGRRLWAFTAADDVTCAAVADVSGDGRPEVLVGSWDTYIYVLDSRGRQVARQQMDAALTIGLSSVRRPVPANIVVGKLRAGEPPRIVVGLKNAVIVCYDLAWKKLWHFSRVEHGTLDIILRDLDGDGTKEIIAANKYGSVEIFDADGRQVGNLYSELGDVCQAVGKFDPTGPDAVANGSSTGTMIVYRWPPRKLFEFDNFGYAWTRLLFADWLNTHPGNELVAASQAGGIFVLDSGGRQLAHYSLPADVNDARMVGDKLIAACGDGRWYALDRRGAVVCRGVVGEGEAAQFVVVAGAPQRPILFVAGEFSAAGFAMPR